MRCVKKGTGNTCIDGIQKKGGKTPKRWYTVQGADPSVTKRKRQSIYTRHNTIPTPMVLSPCNSAEVTDNESIEISPFQPHGKRFPSDEEIGAAALAELSISPVIHPYNNQIMISFPSAGPYGYKHPPSQLYIFIPHRTSQ